MDASQSPDIYVDPLPGDIIDSPLRTATGMSLSPKEDKFITLYIQTSDPMMAAKEAGYAVRPTIKNKNAAWMKKGRELLSKDYVQDEVKHRMEIFRNQKVADTTEVLEYLTAVMRGEVKDQFNLDASIADRTAAAKELAKRLHEIEVATKTEGRQSMRIILERNF